MNKCICMLEWQWEWGTGDMTTNGMGHGGHCPGSGESLGECRHSTCLSWSYSCQSLKDPTSSQLLEHMNYPFIHCAHRREKIGSFFFFLSCLSTFCLSIDRADGNLVSQLPSVPIWSEFIWREIIWLHLLFKNESENRHGVWGGFLSFFPPACPSI